MPIRKAVIIQSIIIFIEYLSIHFSREYYMHKKIFNASYLINVLFQAFFNLLFPLALAFGVGWLLTAKLALPSWIYVPLLLAGLAIGLISMIKFLIYALDVFEKLERGRQQNQEKDNDK